MDLCVVEDRPNLTEVRLCTRLSKPSHADDLHIFIFHILNIFIQGTNSISILFYNLALLELKYLINYYK